MWEGGTAKVIEKETTRFSAVETFAFLGASLAIISVVVFFGAVVPAWERHETFADAFSGASCENVVERVAYAAYGVGQDDCEAYGCHLPYRQAERLNESLSSLANGLSEIQGVSATGTLTSSVEKVSSKEADGRCEISFHSSGAAGWTYSVGVPLMRMGETGTVLEELLFFPLVKSRTENAGPSVSVGGKDLKSFFGTVDSE